ncbi:hypothetical protein SprV_0301309500 [Sparganum proliferum]
MENHHVLPPSLRITTKAVQQFSSRKAPGLDAIFAEIYKRGGPQLMDLLTAFFQMWRKEQVPQNSMVATIVHLYKRKRNRQICANYIVFSLLNIVVMIFACILLNHLEQS